jgi:hypothetical protein
MTPPPQILPSLQSPAARMIDAINAKGFNDTKTKNLIEMFTTCRMAVSTLIISLLGVRPITLQSSVLHGVRPISVQTFVFQTPALPCNKRLGCKLPDPMHPDPTPLPPHAPTGRGPGRVHRAP